MLSSFLNPRPSEVGQMVLGPLGDIFSEGLDTTFLGPNSNPNMGRLGNLFCSELGSHMTDMVGPILQVEISQAHELNKAQGSTT